MQSAVGGAEAVASVNSAQAARLAVSASTPEEEDVDRGVVGRTSTALDASILSTTGFPVYYLILLGLVAMAVGSVLTVVWMRLLIPSKSRFEDDVPSAVEDYS